MALSTMVNLMAIYGTEMDISNGLTERSANNRVLSVPMIVKSF